jgi:hypothetical protein
MRLPIALGVLTFFGTPASAVSWLTVGTDEANAVWSMDADGLRREGQTVIVWLKADHTLDLTVRYRTALSLMQIDCASQSYRRLSLIQRRANGTVLNGSDEADISERPIAPDTMIRLVADRACNRP